MERGQASAGDAAGVDGHGSTETIAGPRTAEEGDENSQSALPTQDPNGGETAARAPPERSHALNVSSRRGGEGGGGTPTQQCAPTARSRSTGGGGRIQQRRTPPHDRAQEPEGEPQPLTARANCAQA